MSINRMFTRVSVSALAVSVLAASSGVALAQQATANKIPGESSAINDIVVTGSHISNRNFKAPTPVTIVGQEAIEQRAADNIANVVYEIPQVVPKPALTGVSQNNGFFVSLRGLSIAGDGASASRTLVLVDSNRIVPTNSSGQVDLNIIPVALVDHIDVVTAGASAAYGSDAVAGVVNVVLKKKLQGFVGSAQYGLSERGDQHRYSANLAWGTSFASGRGQFMIAGEYSNAPDALYQRDRNFSNSSTGFIATGSGLVPQSGLTEANFTNGGVILPAGTVYPQAPTFGIQFIGGNCNTVGTACTAPFAYGINTGVAAGTSVTTNGPVQIGGDGLVFGPGRLLIPRDQRQTLFARTSFELSPAATIWAEALYSRTKTFNDYLANIFSGRDLVQVTEKTQIDSYNAAGVLVGTVANPLLAGLGLANGTYKIGRAAPELGNNATDSTDRVLRGAAGIDGELGGSWRYKAYFQHGESRFKTLLFNDIIEPNLASALDIVQYNGAFTCRVNVPGVAQAANTLNHSPNCVVANPVGPGSLASARNYLTGTQVNIVTYKQDAAEVSVQGELFNTWGGPVSIVAGLDWRKDALVQDESVTDPSGNPIFNFAGDNVNSFYTSGSLQTNNLKSFAGSNTVKEAFGEIGIPLMKDSRFGHSLDLNGAVRYTHYSVGGGPVTTWKFGGTYSPLSGLQFRATRSRDIRVANLAQLFGNGQTFVPLAPAGQAIASQTFLVSTGSASGLSPEVSDTLTAGMSTNSFLIPGLSISVDWYSIKLKGYIGQYGGQVILNSCYNQGATAPNPALCNFVTDSVGNTGAASVVSSGTLHYINNPNLNVGTITSKGVDMEFSYRLPLSRLGLKSNAVLTTRLLSTYVDSMTGTLIGQAPIDHAGDLFTQIPHWRHTLTVVYQGGPLTMNVQARFIGSLKFDNNPATIAAVLPVGNRIAPVAYLNMGLAYKVFDEPGRKLEFFFNVNNLLNKAPQFVGSGLQGGSAVSATAGTNGATEVNPYLYDVVGRAFTVGFRFKL